MQENTVVTEQNDVAKLMQEMLEAGVVFRYAPERFEKLKGGGHPFTSPTRTVETPAGIMIEEAIQPVLEPIILTTGQLVELSQIATAWPCFMRAQMDIFALARQGKFPPELCQLVRQTCTDLEWEYGLTDPGYRSIQPFVRLDAVLTDEGFKVVDINTTRPAGVGDTIAANRVLQKYFPNDPISGLRLERLPMHECFVDAVKRCLNQWASRHRLPGESIPIDVAVRTTDGDYRNFEQLTRSLATEGWAARTVDPTNLESKQMTAVIRSRIKEGDPAYPLLTTGYPDQRCVLSPLYRRFLGNKLWMYLFRLEPFRTIFKLALDAEKHEAAMRTNWYEVLDRAFPAIGVVSGDSVQLPGNQLPLSTLDQMSWTLKDPASSSGRRMFLGYCMGKRKWQEALWQDVADGWIAQQFYRCSQELTVAGPNGEPIRRQLFTKYGLFIFDGRLGGVEFNARTTAVVHGARNTYFNPAFRVRATCASTW